jgi:arylsulfatase A-like enzyme
VTQEQIPPYARGYETFEGTIGRTVAESRRAWPAEKRAPEGAPNIVVILLDDMGYSDIGPFGSEIDTPNLDGLAKTGVALTNYHTTPVCSPARAALLTGLNPHRAGFASVANSDPGFPGLRLELDEDVVSLPEILQGHGYATFGVGKWHLTRDALINEGASKSTWPIQRGFDHYYGSLEGFNSFFHPNQIVRDNTVELREETPEGYYITDDYTDQALSMIKALRASDSRKPFFLYFAHTAMHGPLGAKRVDIDKYRGKYHYGWDEVRVRRHARQVAAGIIPGGTPLPDRNHKNGAGVPAWDSLPEQTRDLYARYMEVYAAMVDNVDQNLGRLLELLEQLGERENTIVVFTSDNGGTGEGGPEGTRSYFSRFTHTPGLPEGWQPDVERDPDLIGGPQAMVHYPQGWGMASNTPFRFYKGQTYAGGVRVPLLLSWPRGLQTLPHESLIRPQYQYVTDLTPTLLDLAGLDHPGHRHNLPTQEIDGVSFAPILSDANSPSTHREQYAEFGGNRGYYRDGWKIVADHQPGTPIHDGEWELYHVETDPNELNNVASDNPALLQELALAWEKAAWENTVFPLQDGRGGGYLDIRRPAEQEMANPVTLLPGTPKLERYRSSKLTALRSFTIDIDVTFEPGNEGVLVSHGDQGGGYSVYIEAGHVYFALNEYGKLHAIDGGPLSPGHQLIHVSAISGEDFRITYILSVNEIEQATLEDVWAFVGMAPFSGIDVGVNRGGPVHWDLYRRHGSFRYTGDLHSVHYTPGNRAPYDPLVLAELELEVALTYD